MKRSRRVLVAMTAGALAAGVAAAPATACNPPKAGVTPSTAHAGDAVHVAVSDVEPGAEYYIAVEGRKVAGSEGTHAGGALRASFEMPDFGAVDRSVAIEVVVTHAGSASGADGASTTHEETGTWPAAATVGYLAPRPSESPSTVSEPPAAAPTPTDEGAPTAAAPKQQAQTRTGVTPVERAARDRTPSSVGGDPATRAKSPPEPRRAERRPPAEVRRATPLAAAVLAPAAPQPRHRADRARGASGEPAVTRVPRRVERVPAMSVLPLVDQSPGDGGLPAALVAALALALLLSIGGPDLLRTLARRPALDAALIEAELQELIAEEHARRTESV